MVVLNSLNFCLSEKLFISPSILNDIIAGQSNLGCRFFPFSTLNISCHSFLACRVSAENQFLSVWGFSCMLLVASSLLLFPCCFSYSFFVFSLFQLDQYVPWHVSPWVYPVWSFLYLLDLFDSFLFHVGEVFNCNLFKNFLIPFLFLFSFWDPYNLNVGMLDIVPEVSETILSSFFLLYSALQKLFPSFYLPAH